MKQEKGLEDQVNDGNKLHSKYLINQKDSQTERKFKKLCITKFKEDKTAIKIQNIKERMTQAHLEKVNIQKWNHRQK